MDIQYREIRTTDYGQIKHIINYSFGMYRYVKKEYVLGSLLNAYLQSCLAEKTFSCAAVKDGRVIGVIMGQAKGDYSRIRHVLPVLKCAYYSILTNIQTWISGGSMETHRQIHRIYDELLVECGQTFDGVLTLFAITQECRGQGVGKELLRRMLAYQKEHDVKKFYLYTDTVCNYGFYDSQGFVRLAERETLITENSRKKEFQVFLYGYEFT